MKLVAFSIFVICNTLIADEQTLDVPRFQTQTADAKPADSSSVLQIRIDPEAPDVTVSGIADHHDLAVVHQISWNDEGLHFLINWRDNLWDEISIPKAMSRWIGPKKRSRDRMYLYDNMRILIKREDYLYAAWISPLPHDEKYLQWDALRVGPRGTPSVEVGAAKTRGKQTRENVTTLSVLFPWDSIKLKPTPGMEFSLDIAVTDSDTPDQTLGEKKKIDSRYLSWSGKLKLR